MVPRASGTQARFVEEVTTAHPITRAIGRLASPTGHHLDLYLADLERVLGA